MFEIRNKVFIRMISIPYNIHKKVNYTKHLLDLYFLKKNKFDIVFISLKI